MLATVSVLLANEDGPERALARHKGDVVDVWGQSSPGKTAAPPTLRSGNLGKKCSDLSRYVYIQMCRAF